MTDRRLAVMAAHDCTNTQCNGGAGCSSGYDCYSSNGVSCTCVNVSCDNYPEDNVCTGATESCTYECVACTSYNGQAAQKIVKCYDTGTGCGGELCYNSYPGTWDAGGQCGYCVNPLTPTQPVGCQVFACYQNTSCGISPAWTDNCGGTGCGYCTGSNPTNTPVPPPPPGDPTPTTCPNTCSSETCRDTICLTETCQDSCGHSCFGALSCTTPAFSSLLISNSDSTQVTADSNSRNHLCETTFFNSSNQRRVIFDANVSDADGYTNISNVSLRWVDGTGDTNSMTFVSGSLSNAIWRVAVDFPAGKNTGSAHSLLVKVTDAQGLSTGWVDSGRDLKVWDCQVPVAGSLYDGTSSGQVCNDTSYTSLVGSSVNFRNLLFRNASVGVSMTATLPSSYGSNNLIWSRTYLPIFNNGTIGSPNGDLNASGRRTRIVDLGTGTTSCPVTDEFDLSAYVSAYSSTPMANVDFSFVLTQEGWFQVVGGGVNAKNEVSSGVPISVGATSRALTLSGTRADNGLVSFLTYSNINANNTNNAYGLSNNWWINRNTNNPLAYSYQNLYNSFFVNRGMGTTGSDWTGKPSEGIYFVNGNLNIDSNFSLAAGRTFIVIVKGNITIDSGVDRLDGIYIADGGITAGGDSATQLVINGMLYSRGNIRLYRSYTDKINNNSSPAVVINYRPDLIFNMPGSLMRVLSGWREE